MQIDFIEVNKTSLEAQEAQNIRMQLGGQTNVCANEGKGKIIPNKYLSGY